MSTIQSEHFMQAIHLALDEVFVNVHGFILDKNTSLLETLAGISAAEASIPVGGKCATLAAQVKHIAFYLDALVNAVRDPAYRADWGYVWRTVSSVTPDEWESMQTELRDSYRRCRELLDSTAVWSSEREIGGAIAIVAHSAYHLGEIRQALCTLRP